MHLISYLKIKEFSKKHPNSKASLEIWYRTVKKNSFNTPSDVKNMFNSVDLVDHLFVFNIARNKYRLIVAFHFNRQKAYIRYILTHKEYEKGKWKK